VNIISRTKNSLYFDVGIAEKGFVPGEYNLGLASRKGLSYGINMHSCCIYGKVPTNIPMDKTLFPVIGNTIIYLSFDPISLKLEVKLKDRILTSFEVEDVKDYYVIALTFYDKITVEVLSNISNWDIIKLLLLARRKKNGIWSKMPMEMLKEISKFL